MISATDCVKGLARYVDAEIMPHVEGWKKVALGAYVGMAGNNAVKALSNAAQHPAIALTGAFTEEGMVDIDFVHNCVKEAMREPMRIDIPMIGVFTLTREDVSRIYDYMRGAL